MVLPRDTAGSNFHNKALLVKALALSAACGLAVSLLRLRKGPWGLAAPPSPAEEQKAAAEEQTDSGPLSQSLSWVYSLVVRVWCWCRTGKASDGTPLPSVADGILGAIGNTPLIRIGSLSNQTGCEILGKAEFLNPGGSVKDRVALQVIADALSSGELRAGGLVAEGSAGSTGISLALVCAALGLRCFVAMPDDAAAEKADVMSAFGAEVVRLRPVSITHPQHFVHVARRRAEEEALVPGSSALFVDQFENLANFRAHYSQTGREVWDQTAGKVHAFVAAAGTGGTIAGVSRFLKERNPGVRCFLADPQGSSLFNRVSRGVLYAREEAEGRRHRNPQDTITEGIGLNRLTANFNLASLDGAFRVSDQEAVGMSRDLLRKDGLFLGSSSAVNCVGALKVAQMLGPGHIIVTVLCDSGTRYLSKFYNQNYLDSWFSRTQGHLSKGRAGV